MSQNKKSILITGGTGSLGKKIVETLLSDKNYNEYERIIIYSRDELKQFEMRKNPKFNDSRIRYFIGDVRDKERLSRAFDGVNEIIHTAALKQVPACEYNPLEAVKTNIMGAANIIDVAIDRNIEKVVALSTDKACAPINIYGATKLCSDKLFIAGNNYSGKHPTRFSVVRYGNVAGSRGSVIPYFKQLINEGAKEIPVTDKRMTRFWLKIEEGCELVLTALKKMQGGELFVKKIPSMRITDLAEAMAPHLPIKEVGIRPGEKIHEMMITQEDARHTVEADKYYIILPEYKEIDGRIYKGEKVNEGFEYHSGNNKEWLSIADIKKLVQEI